MIASDVPMLTRRGTRITPTSTGMRRNAPPAPTSPLRTPIAVGYTTAAVRLKSTLAPTGPKGSGGAGRNISRSARSPMTPNTASRVRLPT